MTSDIKTLITCSCCSTEHQLVVQGWVDDQQCPEIYIEMHLVPVPWYQRITYAFRYIFGLTQPRSSFEEIILFPTQARQLVAAINQHLENQRDYASSNWIDQHTNSQNTGKNDQ